jgi:ATP-binding cassette subfamily B protein
MKILIAYLKNYKKLVLIALLLAATNQIFSLLDPLVFRFLIDNYATKYGEYQTSDFLTGVILLLLAGMGAAMVSRIAKSFQDYYVNVITQKVGTDIYTDGIKHSLSLPYQVFEDQRSGETLRILQKVKEDIEKLISSFINVIFTSVVGISFVMIYALTVYWVIAPIYFATIPILGIVSSLLSKKIKKIQNTIVAKTASLAGATTESLRNIELVKSLGLVNQEVDRLNENTRKILDLELQKVKYVRSLTFVQGTMVNLLRNVILLFMLYLIFNEQISVGEFFSLFIYSFFIFSPLQELGNVINTYRETETSLENFESIMKKQKEKRPDNPKKLGTIEKLSFKDVTFQHQSANSHALTDVSFHAKKGETVAFVGPSGAGKTTLVKLLVGLYQSEHGSISYNNTAIDDIEPEELRGQIGFVTQDTQLFAGSIRENLLFVNPNATDEQCLDVLKRSACQSLMDRVSNGLDSVIGEGGIKVSGGEKQRLSIARALLRNPSVLIFDEATSALDSITEEEITTTIRDLSESKERVMVMIAHRLSTVMHADTIYVLEKGSVAESGKHQDLLDQKGLYYAMWRQQIGERSD